MKNYSIHAHEKIYQMYASQWIVQAAGKAWLTPTGQHRLWHCDTHRSRGEDHSWEFLLCLDNPPVKISESRGQAVGKDDIQI